MGEGRKPRSFCLRAIVQTRSTSWLSGEAVLISRNASMASPSNNGNVPESLPPFMSTRSRQDQKKGDAAEMFTKSLEGLATPNSDLNEQISRLTLKIDQMQDCEGMMLDKVQSELEAMQRAMADTITQFAQTMSDKMDVAVKSGERNDDTDVSDAAASGWAADRPKKTDGELGRDGGMKKTRPKEEPEGSDESLDDSDDEENKKVQNGHVGGDPGSEPSDDGDSSDSSEGGYKRRSHRKNKDKGQGRDKGTRRNKSYESRSSVRKIIKEEFRSSIDKIGDAKFELYRKNWKAMTRDYNIRERHLVRFMNRLFDGDVLLVYQNVRDEHPDASAAEIWKLMSVVCYNSNHQASVRDKVFRPKYDSKTQTIEEYGNAIKTAALALGYGIPERQLIDQFEQGLPTTLEKHVTGLSGTFDEIVAMTAKYQRACSRGSEHFRKIGEGSGEADFITINGRQVRLRPGVLCYRRGCDVNGGRDHFSRDHKEPAALAAQQAPATQGAPSGNGSGVGTGQTTPSMSQ